ncbi:hypothetical protein [Streptomyces olivaceoviridis]|uniref:hypothetical protein n=1 Tax=Streptomyces olivaceoviridis TaxID=1921 RepID=UPI0033333E27
MGRVGMVDRRLLWRLWLVTMSGFAPLLATVGLSDVVDADLSRSLAEDLVVTLLVWAVFSLLAALYVCAALVRRARGTGVPVTVDALRATQERAFPAGQAERLRAGIAASERAYDVTGGAGAWDFQWRPFRGRHAVTGSLTVDRSSGEARVLLRADQGLTDMPGQRRASAFVALCQVTRLGETG